MAFNLYLATAPALPAPPGLPPSPLAAGVMRASLECPYFSSNIIFGPPGTIIDNHWSIGSVELKPFDLDIYIFVGNDRNHIQFNSLGGDDTVLITALPGSRFFVSVLHAKGGGGCIARCMASGQAAQGCVDCSVGPITVRVCC